MSVSTSTTNGVTTVTLTEASPSPSTAGAVHTAKPSRTPEVEESSEPSASPSTPAAAPVAPTAACTAEAAAIAAEVLRVNTAFTTLKTNLTALRGTRDAKVLATAALTIEANRHAAIKAIEATATATCVTADEDNDEDEQTGDNDDHKSPPPSPASVLSVIETPMANDSENDGRGDKVAIVFTGTTPTAIADQAVAAMQAAFDVAKNSPVTTPPPSHTPKVEPLRGTPVDPSHAPKADPRRAPVQMDSKGEQGGQHN